MRSARLSRHGALVTVSLVAIGLGLIAGCSKPDSDEVPASSVSSTSTSATPTEKGPGQIDKSFTPTVKSALPPDQSGSVANSN